MPTAKPRATDRGSTPSPFMMSHTAAYSNHSLIAKWNEKVIARQYARGPALEGSISMLDSTFRDETNQVPIRGFPDHQRRPNRLARADRRDALRLLLQPFGRHRVHRSR